MIKIYYIRISFNNMCNIKVLKQTTTDHYKKIINFKLIKCIITVYLLRNDIICIYFLQSVLMQKTLN